MFVFACGVVCFVGCVSKFVIEVCGCRLFGMLYVFVVLCVYVFAGL